MNLELELHKLKTMVLNESHISDLAKQKIADKIFQIEKGVAINYTRCCMGEAEPLCLQCECREARRDGLCKQCYDKIYTS